MIAHQRTLLTVLVIGALRVGPAAAQDATLRGIVVESEVGVAVAGANVVVRDSAGRIVAHVRADARGRFRVQLPPGQYAVQAELSGRSSAEMEGVQLPLHGRDDIVLVVPSWISELLHRCSSGEAALAGIVYNEQTGLPLPNAEVRLASSSWSQHVTTDARGRYLFCDTPTGTLSLSVRAAGADGRLEVAVESGAAARADIAIGFSGPPIIDVLDARGESSGVLILRGEVRTADRTPVAGASVVVEGSDTARTSEQGQFTVRVRNPSPELTVTVEHPLFGQHTGSFDVGPAADVRLAITLLLSPIQLSSIRVDAAAAVQERRLRSTRLDLFAGAALATAEARGARVTDLLRSFPGVSITEGRFLTRYGPAAGVCVTSTRAVGSLQPKPADWCESVPVYLDGIEIADPVGFLRSLGVTDYESVEFLNAAEAQLRFGLRAGAAGGAIVLHTRGRGPFASEARNRSH